MPNSYPPPKKEWPKLVLQDGGCPFFYAYRDPYTRPFGAAASKRVGEPLIKYCKVESEYSGSVYTHIATYAGGNHITTYVDSTSPYTQYVDAWNTGDTATRGSGYFTLTVGDYEYKYDDPTPDETDSGFGMLKSIKNTVTDDEITYNYTQTWKLTSITEGGTTHVTVNWTQDYDRMTSIQFWHGPANAFTEEEFIYSGSPLQVTGVNENYNDGQTEKTVQAVRWTINTTTGMIQDFSVLNPTNLNTLYTDSYNWVYIDSQKLITSYERFDDQYTVGYGAGTKTIDRQGTNGKEVVTRSTASGVTTVTYQETDDNEPTPLVYYREEAKWNDQYRRLKEFKRGSDSATLYRYGFDKGTPPAANEEKVLLWQTEYPLDNYVQYDYSGTNVTRIGQRNSSTTERAYVQFNYVGDLVSKIYTSNLWEVEIDYDASERIEWIEDGLNRRISFHYNGDDQVDQITNNSKTTSFTYDGDGYLDEVETPMGIVTDYNYDPATGNLVQVTLDEGGAAQSVTQYQYSYSNRGPDLSAVIDGQSRKTGYEYDVYGRLTDELLYTGTGSYTEAARAEYTYHADIGDRLIKKEDFKDTDVDYTYNDAGWVTEISWTPEGQGEWGSVAYTYDTNGSGRVTAITPDGGDCSCSGTLDLAYNSNGQLTSRDSIHVGAIEYDYDDVGRLDEIDVPDRLGTSVLNQVDYTYDAANRVTDIDGTIQENVDLTYNAANQLTQIDFSNGNATYLTGFTYDTNTGRLNQISLEPDAQGRDIDYTYNDDGLVTVAEYSRGAADVQARYEYDGQNRLVRESGHDATVGTCVRLDGTGDYLSVATGGDLSGTSLDEFSVEARIFIEDYPTSTGIIFQRGSSGTEGYVCLYLTSTGHLHMAIKTDEVEDDSAQVQLLPKGEWLHVAGTWGYGSEQVNLYVNGILRATNNEYVTGDLSGTGTAPKIGYNFDGKIDEVRVQNDELNATSFSLSGNYTYDYHTLGLWHMDENTGTTVADSDAAGQQQTATFQGNTSWSTGANDLGIAEYAYKYTYDHVGNRTAQEIETTATNPKAYSKWTLEYNDLNQLTKKYNGLSWTLGTERYGYTYDANGNLTEKKRETKGASWTQSWRWLYDWNPRDQMTKAEKRNSADAYAGKVEYGYCLTCGGALAYRKEYSTTVSTTITSWKRYEYDGINLLRVDEKYDTAGGTIDANDPWRTLEVSTHRPGMLANLLGKRFYVHTNNDATPDGTYDYFYGYDRVGNVVFVYEGGESGDEAFYFTQDAFGNELALGSFYTAGYTWSEARAVGVTEHQTGKWLDPFTGMYYFYARWYDSEVGRFVGRDRREPYILARDVVALWQQAGYSFNRNNPMLFFDSDGRRVNRPIFGYPEIDCMWPCFDLPQIFQPSCMLDCLRPPKPRPALICGDDISDAAHGSKPGEGYIPPCGQNEMGDGIDKIVIGGLPPSGSSDPTCDSICPSGPCQPGSNN